LLYASTPYWNCALKKLDDDVEIHLAFGPPFFFDPSM